MLRMLDYLRPSANERENQLGWRKALWIANIVFGAMFILSLLVVDLNDRYPGMTFRESQIARFLWSGCGILISACLAVCCRSGRFTALVALVAYGLLGVPFLTL